MIMRETTGTIVVNMLFSTPFSRLIVGTQSFVTLVGTKCLADIRNGSSLLASS